MSTFVGFVLIGLLIYGLIRARSQSKPPSRDRVLSRSPRVTISIDIGSDGGLQFPSTTRQRVEPAKLARAGDRLSVSNSSSGRRWKLDHAPAVGDPTHMVEFGTGRRAFAREA